MGKREEAQRTQEQRKLGQSRTLLRGQVGDSYLRVVSVYCAHCSIFPSDAFLAKSFSRVWICSPWCIRKPSIFVIYIEMINFMLSDLQRITGFHFAVCKLLTVADLWLLWFVYVNTQPFRTTNQVWFGNTVLFLINCKQREINPFGCLKMVLAKGLLD